MGRDRKNRRAKGPDLASIPAPLPPSTPSPASPADRQSQKDKDDKVYEGYRTELLKAEQNAAESYDKWILTLAGIALGFSLSVVKDFIKPSNNSALKNIWCLYTAWILFSVPVALITFNLQVSYSAFKKYRKILDGLFKKYDELDDFWKETTKKMSGVWRNYLIECFNWISLMSFLGGIGFLVAFVWRNVR